MDVNNGSILKNNSKRFIIGKGFMNGDIVISSFEPIVKRRIISHDISSGTDEIFYEVLVKKIDGTESESVRVKDFRSIQWYELFGVNDAELSGKDKTFLLSKLQEDTIKLNIPICHEIIGKPGFYKFKEIPIMILDKKNIIFPNNKEIIVKSLSKYNMKTGYINNIDLVIKKYISFMEGVTEILFYTSLLGVIEPILKSLSIIKGFVVAVDAPSGHLKTTLVRIYAKFLQEEVQEITFDSVIKNDELTKQIEELATQNILIDDYHMKAGTYYKNKFSDRLDWLTRIASSPKQGAGIFITAESVAGASIFSGQDRLLQVRIPKMSSNDLCEYKQKLVELSDYEMAVVAIIFVEKIINDFDNAVRMIEAYVTNYQMPEWCDPSTRLGRHNMIVTLVEYLFCYYICDNNPEKSRHSALISALKYNGKLQTKQLLDLRRDEEQKSFLFEINEIINEGTQCKDIEIKTLKSDYSGENNRQALLNTYERKFYITSNALQEVLLKRIGKPVSKRKVSDELHDAGVLIEDIDKRSSKYNGRRHYIIDIAMLKRICDSMKDTML